MCDKVRVSPTGLHIGGDFPVKLVSPEALNESQRSELEGYSRFFPAGSVCVNVMLGPEPWDLRPLLLLLGKVHLARFSMALSDSLARSVTSELEGFSVLCTAQQRAQLLPGQGRFMLIRPYFAETLKDELERGRISSARERLDMAHGLIRRVAELSRRSLAHGHICPANIVRDGANLLLIDPFVGTLHQSSDLYLPPESASGKPPEPLADLYCLGKTLTTLLGESLSAPQRSIVEQLILPAPRQRPRIEEVAAVFGLGKLSVPDPDTSSDSLNVKAQKGSGRLLRPGAKAAIDRNTDRIPEQSTSNSEVLRTDAPKREGSWTTPILIGVATIFAAGWIIKDRYPALYFELTSRVPMLAAQHSAEYEAEWASRDRTRMAVVGRAAVIRREPAAINTIVNDLIAGANPDGVQAALLRVALSDGWQEDLTPVDKHAALVFALEGLVPEGRAQIADTQTLHPGVLLAVLGQSSLKHLPNDLKNLPVDILTRLPAPFGQLFSQAKAMGVAKLGDTPAIGLAQIVTGNANSEAFDRFLGSEQQAGLTLAKVSLIEPVVSASEATASELLNVLGDRGGDIATLIHWFDLEDLAGWGSAKAADKISLVLGNLPQGALTVAQLSDLLMFPLEKVRAEAAGKLRSVFTGQEGERLLATLTTPASGLSREQIIALLSALAVPPESRIPFITAWFNLAPPADSVVLVLLSRSHVDSKDVFNLEAARFLRRANWNATPDILRLLSRHPEPLARVLAYGRLDPSVDESRSILLERKGLEKDETCLRVLQERLASFKKAEPEQDGRKG